MNTFTDTSDICQQLLHRYGNSAAPQHCHLCATAAATRSIIQSESLPLTPFSYFASTISTLSNQTHLDSDALSALSSFLSIVLPLVPEKAIASDKAQEAVEVVVQSVNSSDGDISLGTASMRALIKSLGLLLGFCDLDDWDSIKLGFNTLLFFSIDKRPKVRKCAQDCIMTGFKAFKSSAVIKKASKTVYSLFKIRMPLAVKISAVNAADGSKDDIMSKPELQELVHMLHVLKALLPYLSVEVSAKVLSQLLKLLSPEFSALSRHIFDVIEAIFQTSKAEVTVQDLQDIIKSLSSYIKLSEKNPLDTVLSAASLTKQAIDKLHSSETTEWFNHLPLVIGSIACLLNSEASIALQGSKILIELIKRHMDEKVLLMIKDHEENEKVTCSAEIRAMESICAVFSNLFTGDGTPNEHSLAVISVLFLRLEEVSDFYMKDIVLKLADVITLSSVSGSDATSLKKCLGYAVVAMGPEKLLALLPISLNEKSLSCSHTWLIPILKEYVVGSSLGFFMEHIMPLAESMQRGYREVKKFNIGQDLQANAYKCWELLPAFCRYPADTRKNFGTLAKLLISCCKDLLMLKPVAIALQVLVNQNKDALSPNGGPQGSEEFPKLDVGEYFMEELKCKHSYSTKTANRNIKALASCSEELLHALVDVMFELAPEKHEYLKDAIGCLASIADPSITKNIFISSLKRLQLIHSGKHEEVEHHDYGPVDAIAINAMFEGIDRQRCLILDLALSFVDGASEDLISLLFKVTKHALQATGEIGQLEAYQTLRRMLEKHPSFASSKFSELMELLLNLKSPSDISLLRSRFACFRILLINAVKENLDEEDTKPFLFLNEIILTLKDSKEEGRKAAYDVLIEISSSLRNFTSNGPYQKIIAMVLGYLTGSSPHIKSGAVSALSVLVYIDTDICLSIPDLVPSVLSLLQNKAVEVIKAILGFVKVLVSSLQAKDLQNFLPEIVNGILPWSSMSRHHFRSKVTVILEIMIRKCGIGAVRSFVPHKYGSFLKSVSENRHGKTNSKDADAVVSKTADASQTSQPKRKREESGVLREEDSTGFRKMKRENKSVHPRKFLNRNGKSNQDKEKVSESPWQRKDGKRNFGKGQSGTKRKEMRAATKQKEADIHKPSFKLSKLEGIGKKRLKTSNKRFT